MNKPLTADERQLINDTLDVFFKDDFWSGKKRLEEFKVYLIDGDSIEEFKFHLMRYNSILEFCKGYKKEEDQSVNQMNFLSMYYEWKANDIPPMDKSQAEIDRASKLFDEYKHTPIKDFLKFLKHK